MSRNKHSKTRRIQNGAQAPRSGRTPNQTRTAQGNLQAAAPQEPGSKMMKRMTALKSSVGDELSTDLDSARIAVRSAQQRAGEMAGEARDMMARASASTMRTIKENPVPVALAGIGIVAAGAGLTWLILSSGAKAVEQGAQSAASELPKGDSLVKSARKGVTKAGRAASDKVSQLAHDATEQAKRAEQAVEGAVSEHPLIVGAALLAAGTAIGLAIPRTKLENGWLGRERDHLMQAAQTVARGAVDKVGTLARQALTANNANHAQA
jgi:hypothetical protein